MKKGLLVLLFAAVGAFAIGCGPQSTDEPSALVVEQAPEDIVGAVTVYVSEEAPEVDPEAEIDSYMGQLIVAVENLNVRDSAETTGEVLATLMEGDAIYYLEKEGDWYKVEVENEDGQTVQGYVSGDYVTVVETEAEKNGFTVTEIAGKITVTADTLKVRDTPSTDGEEVASLAKDDEVEYYEESGGWYHVRVQESADSYIDGYVSADYVEVAE